ncbi:MAG: magnesium chelatase [Candidatus Sungbacteria bacterium RIFCSPLOWO2_01_FULL_47_32]|uniref:Magnesium chelatase n=1 Tax=Candidatus Sungbacteria bacterium RIFCSPHIGHO2_01_FULL_47_32 TaxID=1802264 RepID=A0A1G2KB72_9BACT|nr:MAG: Mg chelatase-related protein [Parcubacteria group bacterium GW2011_GWA2_47_10]OGZ95710.1 MAG: magnesium chelatase [Candidatus Sungbacteria bacterium RIFCSPHIGHO2_01_FULL_47_32]OGZ98243.1 MAG: magnesium chelatase [Candidatus Sungbacteria bacterium RIFCSPHIGHO2_02_FULL_46_12]OHA05339.1 MAG: magnesium chelatase [Candidatus Sungbacteria bacterium RIFCSPLOWO2_01_FULL_47_32]
MIKISSSQVVGIVARPVDVEVDLSPGLHVFSIVGLADKEIQESRERIGSAIRNIGARPPHKKSQRVIINLSPADLKKEGPAFDLPIALGYLLASEQTRFDPEGKLFIGELGLDGAIKKVSGVLPITILARDLGLKEIYVPKGNGREASLVPGISIYEVESLVQLLDGLEGRARPSPFEGVSTADELDTQDFEVDFSHIKGQETAKRAIEIAAAGGHNLLLEGPPGTGKTLLAKAIPSALPKMTHEEIIEVTKIYSVAGELADKAGVVTTRPFRSPHHTASPIAITGGGSVIKPGEITLSHRGVLFLDEFPEFDRRVLESLRQPLEEKKITIARAQGSETFPADFMLVAAMNPCPCGNYTNPKKECVCTSGAISKYRRKISGPLLDRIDLYIEVPNIEYEKLEEPRGLHADAARSESAEIKNRVERARDIQRVRFAKDGIITNSRMKGTHIKKYCVLDVSSQELLKKAYDSYNMSPRSYYRLIRTARTIADLEGSSDIKLQHLSEALQYRPKAEI